MRVCTEELLDHCGVDRHRCGRQYRNERSSEVLLSYENSSSSGNSRLVAAAEPANLFFFPFVGVYNGLLILLLPEKRS